MNSELPLIVLKGLEGNPPATLTPIQQAMLPYEHYLEIFWWSLWFATLTFLILNFVLPRFLETRRKRYSERPEQSTTTDTI